LNPKIACQWLLNGATNIGNGFGYFNGGESSSNCNSRQGQFVAFFLRKGRSWQGHGWRMFQRMFDDTGTSIENHLITNHTYQPLVTTNHL